MLILDEKFSGLNIHVGKGLLSLAPHLTFHCSFFRIVSTSPPRALPFLVFLVLALPYWYFTSFRDGKYWAWTSSQSGREPRVSARVHPTVMLLQVVHVLNAGNLTRNPSLIAEPVPLESGSSNIRLSITLLVDILICMNTLTRRELRNVSLVRPLHTHEVRIIKKENWCVIYPKLAICYGST